MIGMALKAILFDLDDTLLWDERSVREAFHETCLIAAKETGVKPEELEEAVRNEARGLYESYETFPFTKMIGIFLNRSLERTRHVNPPYVSLYRLT